MNSLIVLLYRGGQAVFGVISVALYVALLTPGEIGLYQTMVNLAGLYMFLDMGLSSVLVQLCAARSDGVLWRNGCVVGGASNPASFLALIKYGVGWYVVVGMLFLLSFPAGFFFLRSDPSLDYSFWLAPWGLLVLATGMQMPLQPLLSSLEGAGHIAEVYGIRLVGVVTGSLLAWSILLSGGSIWAASMMPLSAVFCVSVWLLVKRRGLLLQVYKAPALQNGEWRQTVWPLQWRGAAGWLSGYAQVFVHVPILYKMQGAVAAGKMGVTMTVINTLSVVSLAYPVSKVPGLVACVARSDWQGLKRLFTQVWQVSFAMYGLGALCVFGLALILNQSLIGSRLLPLPQVALLLVAVGFYHLATVLGIYIRSHLVDPLVRTSLIAAGLTMSLSVMAASFWGSMGNVLVILLVNALVYLPLTLLVLRRVHHDRCKDA